MQHKKKDEHTNFGENSRRVFRSSTASSDYTCVFNASEPLRWTEEICHFVLYIQICKVQNARFLALTQRIRHVKNASVTRACGCRAATAWPPHGKNAPWALALSHIPRSRMPLHSTAKIVHISWTARKWYADQFNRDIFYIFKDK